ncbi:hypothetical protein TorRG33x02_160510 [Trema orientale]|uniref:Uncharacterized protein n=1 Tax=Trema orientale TaxID=63057 RepID=A0A2P5ERS8_TREOI|nr:hypothetical protein TorRG33x02_160510 [Trema orientale]
MNEEMKLYKSADCKTSNKNAKTKEMKKETNNLNMCLIERMWGPDLAMAVETLFFSFSFSCCRNCFSVKENGITRLKLFHIEWTMQSKPRRDSISSSEVRDMAQGRLSQKSLRHWNIPKWWESPK